MAVSPSKAIYPQVLSHLGPKAGVAIAGGTASAGHLMRNPYFSVAFPYAQFANAQVPPVQPKVKESELSKEFGGDLKIPYVEEKQVHPLEFLKESYIGTEVSSLRVNAVSGAVTPISQSEGPSFDKSANDPNRKPGEKWDAARYRHMTGKELPQRHKLPVDDPQYNVAVDIIPVDLEVRKLHENKIVKELADLGRQVLVKMRVAEFKNGISPASSMDGSTQSRKRSISASSNSSGGDTKSGSSQGSKFSEIDIRKLFDNLSDSRDPIKRISRRFQDAVSQVKKGFTQGM